MTGSTGAVPVEGGFLYYERTGEGFPVVLIHAGYWDSRMWEDQFEVFATQNDLVRYDMRGYGRSDRPKTAYSDLADLERLLDHLGMERVAVVGASLGGAVAIDYALARPERVDALVLAPPGLSGYDWPGGGAEALREAERERVAAGDLEGAVDVALSVWTPLRTDPAVDERIRRIAMENADVFAVDDSLREPPPPAVEGLGEVEAATLIVVGERDVTEEHELADLLVERIPGATKRVIAGADHLVNVRAPERFNRLVLDFLSFRM